MENLIIVESPTKAKTIKNFLEGGYEVIASKGHIRDLPKTKFGITIEEGEFIPEYRVDSEHSEVVKTLKGKAKNAKHIYIATDEDREGEAIGFHIAHAIGKDPEQLPRIVFHEITKKAIIHSLENPRTINMSMVNAQQARRLLDRIVGYKLSPLISAKIQKGLSAGRVQSSALKIIVDREKEIRDFVPVVYYSIKSIFKDGIESELVEYKNNKIEKLTIQKEDEANAIVETTKKERFSITSIETKSRKTSTPPPFMTSTLQQSASTLLGFSPKRTMSAAQKLYEGVKTPFGESGVITYMRTDSLNLANEAVESAREYIEKTYGKSYLPASKKNYVTKSKSAQEAHEAIRPTIIDFTPAIAREYLKGDEIKLYILIYNRFIACQMEDARFETQNVIFESPSLKYRAQGRKLVFDGFYKVLGDDDKDKLLPELQEGKDAELQSVDASKNQTEPPSRYSEASLIKKLESLGIGRPSTYAPTISILQSRNYINVTNKQIVPEEIAFKVTEMLEGHFQNIVDSGFTARLEEELDEIAENKKDWQELLREFYEGFEEKIAEGKKNIKSQKVSKPTGQMCPECGKELVIRSGRFGEFTACSGYPKCKYVVKGEGEAQEKKEPEESGETCEKCGAPMVIREGRRGKFLACKAFPKCKNTKSIEGGEKEKKEVKKIEAPCPECGGELLHRYSRRGAFIGCSNYPKCAFISKFEPSDKKCPKCGYAMAFRTYRGKEIYECLKCKERVDA